ncbi:MAG: anti-sigma factor [Geminicoccaceae bacterium]
MNYDSPELRERLTTEYALGTLRGPARKRFERLMAEDRELADTVEDWELRLNHLGESAPTLEPPPRLWANIAQELWAEPKPERHAWLRRLWDDVRLWRGLSAVGAAAAGALALHLALQPPRVEVADLTARMAAIEARLNATNLAPSHVAVLIDKYERPMMTADLSVAEGRLALRLNITPPRDFTGKMLEVWMQSGDELRSLGLFPSEKSGTTTVFVLSQDVADTLAQGKLEVSLEPTGGSMSGAPTGPVLFSGPILPVAL